MLTLQEKIGWFALYSRIIVIALSAVFNFIIPDHDAGVFLSPIDPLRPQSVADDIVSLLFGGLVRWDAQYFIHIASYGYTYENCLAFFPLYPLCVRFLAGICYYPLQGIISQYSLIIISAILINIICFVLCARTLYDLSLKVLKNKEVAYKAALLFCVNPASIFFSAPYSETMFAYLTFYGMLKCENNRLLDSGILFGLAGATRSNGLLNIGFIFYRQFQEVFIHALPHSFSNCKALTFSHWRLIRALLFLSVATLLSLAPFCAFQAYGYYKFCFPSNHNLPDFIIVDATNNGYVLPAASVHKTISGHWCNATVPLAYSYVQSYYWNVGFLKYYEWKQIPNFLLALPVAFIIISQSVHFVRQHPQYCFSLGLLSPPVQSKGQRTISNEVKFPHSMFVYTVHAVFLVVFCFLCIHVQVTTRLISSASPVIYWFVAYFFTHVIRNSTSDCKAIAKQFQKISNTKHSNELDSHIEPVKNLYSKCRVNIFTQNVPNNKAKIIMYYFVLYFLLGTVMFSNFLPWT